MRTPARAYSPSLRAIHSRASAHTPRGHCPTERAGDVPRRLHALCAYITRFVAIGDTRATAATTAGAMSSRRGSNEQARVSAKWACRLAVGGTDHASRAWGQEPHDQTTQLASLRESEHSCSFSPIDEAARDVRPFAILGRELPRMRRGHGGK